MFNEGIDKVYKSKTSISHLLARIHQKQKIAKAENCRQKRPSRSKASISYHCAYTIMEITEWFDVVWYNKDP